MKNYTHNVKGYKVRAVLTNNGFYLFRKPGKFFETSMNSDIFEERYTLVK